MKKFGGRSTRTFENRKCTERMEPNQRKDEEEGINPDKVEITISETEDDLRRDDQEQKEEKTKKQKERDMNGNKTSILNTHKKRRIQDSEHGKGLYISREYDEYETVRKQDKDKRVWTTAVNHKNEQLDEQKHKDKESQMRVEGI